MNISIGLGWLLCSSLVVAASGCAANEANQHEQAELDVGGAAALQARPEVVPPPPGVKFTSVAASGAGCPQNTPGVDDSYYADLTPEGDAFTIEFYKFKASITPTDPRPATSLSCTMRVGLTVPQGYQYTVTDVVFQGESSLPASTTASLVSSYGYQGSGIAPVNVTHPIKTPSTLEQFKFRDVLSSTPVGRQWSRCGETQLLNVNMVLQISNPERANGWAELSYVDADVRTTLEDPTPSTIPGLTVNIAWRRCPSP